jgi:hypothetical protein
MIPFFAVLHLVAVLQSRHNWDDRVRHYAIPSQNQAPTRQLPWRLPASQTATPQTVAGAP